MKKTLKPIALLLAVLLTVCLCYGVNPIKKPSKKQKAEQTAQPSKQQPSKPAKSSKQDQVRMQEEQRKYKGHEYVDLGLPSGLKWATCNVGASSPEDYGSYFAWGDTSPKSSYDIDNCATSGKNDSWLRSNGYIDSLGNLVMTHDAARQNWGGIWRMPTMSEIEELVEYTTTIWATQNGVNGRLFTSKRNGKSIFFPAAGQFHGAEVKDQGSNGSYWSATICKDDAHDAICLFFDSAYYSCRWSFRIFSGQVRPVSE